MSNGGMDLVLQWDRHFPQQSKQLFESIQSYVDQQSLARMTLYVPVGLPRYRNSGKLRDSGKVQSPGRIVYTARFARHDYYANVNHQNGGNPFATRLWFETMKARHADRIRAGAQGMIGGHRWM